MIDDPRLAGTIIAAVDRRVEQLLAARERHVRYGVVASVDTANRKASVYLGGDATATPGFAYGALQPEVGDLVRVEIGAAHDYVIAGSRSAHARFAGVAKTRSGKPLVAFVPLIPYVAHVDAATFTAADSAAQSTTMTFLPAAGVIAVYAQLAVRASTANSANAVSLIPYDGTDTGAAFTVWAGAVANFTATSGIIVATGGLAGNSRTIKYWRSWGAGTVTWYLRIHGYFTATED